MDFSSGLVEAIGDMEVWALLFWVDKGLKFSINPRKLSIFYRFFRAEVKQ